MSDSTSARAPQGAGTPQLPEVHQVGEATSRTTMERLVVRDFVVDRYRTQTRSQGLMRHEDDEEPRPDEYGHMDLAARDAARFGREQAALSAWISGLGQPGQGPAPEAEAAPGEQNIQVRPLPHKVRALKGGPRIEHVRWTPMRRPEAYIAHIQQGGDYYDTHTGDEVADPLQAALDGEVFEFIGVCSYDHTLWREDGRQVPQAIGFDYINGRIDESTYDLPGLIRLLKARPDVVIHSDERTPDTGRRGRRDQSRSGIIAIPSYNAQEGRTQTVEFSWMPREDDMPRLRALRGGSLERQHQILMLDLLGLKEAEQPEQRARLADQRRHAGIEP